MSQHPDLELLSAYLDGEVAAPERARLEAHLGSCAACASARLALAGAIRSVATLPGVVPTPEETRAIRQAVLNRAKGSVPVPLAAGWRRRLSWQLYAAAGAAAVLVAGLVGYAALRAPNHTAASSAAAPGLAALPAPLALSSGAAAQAFAAAQPAVEQGLRTLTPAAAPAATSRFFAELAGGPLPGAVPGAAAPLTGLAAPALPAPSPSSQEQLRDSGLAPPFSPGSLAACVQAVLGGLPAPAAPLQASEATYQGTPAWLVVFATAPPGSGGATPLSQGQVFVQSRPGCTTLDHSSFTR
ncbi:MAG: hypothetical protein NVSMB32_13960 [Actinomycetota bacterium]